MRQVRMNGLVRGLRKLVFLSAYLGQCCPWLCPQNSSLSGNKLDSYRCGEQTPVQRLARAPYQLRTHACEPERGKAPSPGRPLPIGGHYEKENSPAALVGVGLAVPR